MAPVQRRPSPPRLLIAAGILLIAALLALGTWQVQRRAWKLDLIARVDARVHSPAMPAPGPAAWRRLDRRNAEYTRVAATGMFDHAVTVRVQAVTVRGGGYWLLTPLATDRGFTVLVNRGFVPAEGGAPVWNPAGRVRVEGLLRWTEPGGGFLRANDPAAGRWHSRDVAAIAAHRRLHGAAPYFIDADAVVGHPAPAGGMTVIAFANNHLVYALTWYALAAMTVAALVVLYRRSA